ncbi:ComEC/Rec2 family competence protein [Planctomicrobium sp. SH661]|uniref:ComEC/Rec2 family competence protein n=1 Tax=Planctomicrobium sp. SH661 TaxID=3448124 RepID=UPI003F5B20B6
MRRLVVTAVLMLSVVMGGTVHVRADGVDGRLDIYFIDVEGGAATLMVTPAGESILIDSGYPDLMDRDRDRILKVAKDVAKLSEISHAVVTHWHMDHYGNHASVAAVLPIRDFWDRGIPDALKEDPEFQDRIALYRAATQNRSHALQAGNRFDIPSDATPLSVTILTASREMIENTGEPNPFAAQHEPMEDDDSDNAASISLLFQYGPFKFLCCGDLTWNMEKELVTPNNPIGQVDLFMATHHGLGVSNNPVFVKAIDPVTCVMCNGPDKGGDPKVISTIRSCPSLKALYQLHRNVSLSAADQTPEEFIANLGTTTDCKGNWVKASVARDGKSYTIQIGADGKPTTYATRGTGK